MKIYSLLQFKINSRSILKIIGRLFFKKIPLDKFEIMIIIIVTITIIERK